MNLFDFYKSLNEIPDNFFPTGICNSCLLQIPKYIKSTKLTRNLGWKLNIDLIMPASLFWDKPKASIIYK